MGVFHVFQIAQRYQIAQNITYGIDGSVLVFANRFCVFVMLGLVVLSVYAKCSRFVFGLHWFVVVSLGFSQIS